MDAINLSASVITISLFILLIVDKAITRKWFSSLKVIWNIISNYRLYSKRILENPKFFIDCSEHQDSIVYLLNNNQHIFTSLKDMNITQIDYKSASHEPQRQLDYQNLKDNAKKSLYIMGVGLTNVSKDYQAFLKYLERGVNVQVLMIDPEVFEAGNKYYICPKMFNEFFKRENYHADIKQSLSNFKDKTIQKILELKNKCEADFAINRNLNDYVEVSFELKVYNIFAPINITIKDSKMNEHGEMIIEFCFPNTENNRLMLHAGYSDTNNIFTTAKNIFEDVWSNSSTAETVTIKIPRKYQIES